ncbi:MAG: two-component system alkaline phosphatase synthesis response regulator PhoP [Crocinitomix sp.]|jgi:two-component system alkaline phosphatase synthesis response regulator PhoP
MEETIVLLIEDDQAIADLVILHLKNIHYKVDHRSTITEGLAAIQENDYSLLLLDLMLPDGDGMDLCRKLRQEKYNIPIIMLTAKTEEIDLVLGLESGADDYIAKPFSIREFLARVRATIRRFSEPIQEGETKLYTFENLEIDVAKRKVRLNGNSIDLTKKEFELLYLLVQNIGVSYSRSKLLDLIWGYNFKGYEHTVNSHINRLRNKIEKNPSKPDFILTSWGVGYKFNDEL